MALENPRSWPTSMEAEAMPTAASPATSCMALFFSYIFVYRELFVWRVVDLTTSGLIENVWRIYTGFRKKKINCLEHGSLEL